LYKIIIVIVRGETNKSGDQIITMKLHIDIVKNVFISLRNKLMNKKKKLVAKTIEAFFNLPQLREALERSVCVLGRM